LKRRSKADDVESIKKALAAKGYEFKGDISREQLKTLRFEKNIGGKVCSVTIGLTINDQRVGVAAFQ
ncbi:MAG: hypothetical protein K6U74_16020, partial [Firmicutes bacterium]|nr:hypothetical protein [Bacillota bacterium]